MSLSNKLAITDVDLKGKRVLMRVSPPCHTAQHWGFQKIPMEYFLNTCITR